MTPHNRPPPAAPRPVLERITVPVVLSTGTAYLDLPFLIEYEDGERLSRVVRALAMPADDQVGGKTP